METFKFEVLHLDLTLSTHGSQWVTIETGERAAKYPEDILDDFDFGHVEMTADYGSDGTVQRTWNAAYDDFGVDRYGVIVSPVETPMA